MSGLDDLRAVALDPAADAERRLAAARLWLQAADAAGLDTSWNPGGLGPAASEVAGVVLALTIESEPEADDADPASEAAPVGPSSPGTDL